MAQGSASFGLLVGHPRTFKPVPQSAMAPKAAMKGSAMTKGALTEAIATACEIKKSGVFTIPGLCRIKTRRKPATKAGKREIFGKVGVVKAKPAKTVVKAFAVAALKKNF